MKKFIYILFICSKIFEASGGEDETDSSQEVQSEFRTPGDHSPHYSLDLNRHEDLIIDNPYAQWFQESMLMPTDGSSKGVASTNQNIHSSSTQQEMLHQHLRAENPLVGNLIIAREAKKNEANFDKGKKPASIEEPLKFRDENEINKLIQIESSNPYVQNMISQDQMMSMSMPYQIHQPIQHSGSSLVNPYLPADSSYEQWRQAQADLFQYYHHQHQQQHFNQPIHHHIGAGGTSHDQIHHQEHQQIFRPIPSRIHPDDNPNQTSSHHQTLQSISGVQGQHSGIHDPPLMPQGFQSGIHMPQTMLHELHNNFPSIHHLPPTMEHHGLQMDNFINQSAIQMLSIKHAEDEKKRRDKKGEILKALQNKITVNCKDENKGKLTELETFIASRNCIIKMERELIHRMRFRGINEHYSHFGLFEHIRENHEEHQIELHFPNPLGLKLNLEEGNLEKDTFPITEDLQKEKHAKAERKRREKQINALNELHSTIPTFLLELMELTQFEVMFSALIYLEILETFKNYHNDENFLSTYFSTIF